MLLELSESAGLHEEITFNTMNKTTAAQRMTDYAVWRAFHFNLCEVLQIDPEQITTVDALQLAGTFVGCINGLIEGLSALAVEHGYADIDEFYSSAYQELDRLD